MMPRMGRGHKREKIKEHQVQGVKHFTALLPLLSQLHGVATERDRAGNRKLHFDQYAALFLLAMFNPIITSLRALQQASGLKKVQRKLGCARASLIALYTGRRPTLRTYEMVCWYFSGMADEQELLNHLAKLQKQA